MARIRRTTSLALSATAAAALLLVTVPVQALVPVTPAPWTPGYAPQGCVITAVPSDATYGYVTHYSDTGVPTIRDFTFGGGATTVTLPPAGRAVDLIAHADEACSGVGGLAAGFARVGHNAAYQSVFVFEVTPDPFHATFGSPLGTLKPSFAGAYHVPLLTTVRRYDTFTLSPEFALIGSPTPGTGGVFQVGGPWMNRTLYVLRQTTLTAAQSATTVRRGRSVTVSGVLRYATDAGFAPDNGEKVLVQTKIGKAAWKTRATLVAHGVGTVAWAFKPTSTTSVRFVHVVTHAGRFTAGVVSATRTIKVA